MKNNDKLIIKICKSVIVVFGVLTVFNVIMLINKKSYALFQKTVETNNVIHIQTANEFPSENKGLDDLKDKTDDGIKGVDPDNGIECEKDCKEYRYVGANVNNYVYFNCDPTQVQSKDTCEMWRIVGIFKDEETGKEHLKIVKNEALTVDMLPRTYTYGETTYKIKYSSSNTGSEPGTAYWNENETKGSDNNDWATAGLQYWLNDETEKGYLSELKEEAKEMIAKTKYYLGSVGVNDPSNSVFDTPKTAYQHERDVKQCVDNTSTENLKEGCYVWKGNQATWEGKVGLLYPSDYGFSADVSNWGTKLYEYESASTSTWLTDYLGAEWFLSPSTWYTRSVCYKDVYERVSSNYNDGASSVRPVLNLKSEVDITGGTGTSSDPYQLG